MSVHARIMSAMSVIGYVHGQVASTVTCLFYNFAFQGSWNFGNGSGCMSTILVWAMILWVNVSLDDFRFFGRFSIFSKKIPYSYKGSQTWEHFEPLHFFVYQFMSATSAMELKILMVAFMKQWIRSPHGGSHGASMLKPSLSTLRGKEFTVDSC